MQSLMMFIFADLNGFVKKRMSVKSSYFTSAKIKEYAAVRPEQAVGGRPPPYDSTPCKLTIYSYLFARGGTYSGTLAI